MRIFLALAILFVAVPSFAETPRPPDKKTTLKALEKKIKNTEENKTRLENQIKDIEGALEDTRSKLVKLSKDIQSNEHTLQGLESRIDELEIEEERIKGNLEKDRESISRLILALNRIRRVPPEAIIAKPGAPFETAQSAMLMSDIIPALTQQAEALKRNLENLENISNDLREKRDDAQDKSKKLKAEYDQLAGLVKKREHLFKATHKNLEAEQREAKAISKQARSIKDFVAKLERKEAQRRKEAARASLPPSGNARLPISGIIRTAYNQKDALGAPSQGISIEGRGGALVVAPMGGTVRFAGEFKNFGNMIIVEHKGGYHSLIAGLEKIDTVVGQSLSAGEPVGHLHYPYNGETPALYYELRLNGKPINPARKLGNLS